MARITSPICKKCRREGAKLFLKGERCFSPKCAFIRRSYAPGVHGQGRKRLTEYGHQMREKQKAKIIYGVLEKQFRRYYEQVKKQGGKESLLGVIERRFDNVIFRIGLAVSRREARQMVLHGTFKINGRKNNIPSCQLKIGDKIELNNKEKSKDLIKNLKSNQKRMTPISWIKLDPDEITAEVTSYPKKEDVGDEINEKLIIEYYSR